MEINALLPNINFSDLIQVLTSLETYSQIAFIALALVLSYLFSRLLEKQIKTLNNNTPAQVWGSIVTSIQSINILLMPLLAVFFLMITSQFSQDILETNWLIRIVESCAIVLFLYLLVARFITSKYIRFLIKWFIIPIALLEVMGLLDPLITYLDSISLDIGNIRISTYGVARLIIFGVILFWLGRISNNFGQQMIRSQQDFDISTREVFAKLYEFCLFGLIFLIMLQLLGINFTTLAVFGGALGVGLGFGLQSIASNFISGIIILLDRSITVGDHIELEDGKSGVIRQLNMRSAVLETYDGKDIMVPNEQFISTNFINWTHNNKKQRYPIEFTVAYDTDLDVLFPLLREIVSSHPSVLSGDAIPEEERPDAEIAGFGDYGIDILIEFWMEGIDDGENRVAADLNYLIWKALKEHQISIPYPIHEVKILNSNFKNV